MKRTISIFLIILTLFAFGLKSREQAPTEDTHFEVAHILETSPNGTAFIDEGGEVWEVYDIDLDITETYFLEINDFDEIVNFYVAD